MSCDDYEAYFADEEAGNSERVNGFPSSQSESKKKKKNTEKLPL